MMNNTDSIIQMPEKLKSILDKKAELSVQVQNIAIPFSAILKTNDLPFFKEYTDHGIKHIENTLQFAENLIAEGTFKYLTPEEVGVLVLSVILHDIGMHTNGEMFKNMIEGKYDNLVDLFPNGKTWKELWKDFLYDSQYWGKEKKNNVFGNPNYNIQTPDLTDLQKLNEYDKKLIGEFVRIHHCRIAHEVSINGYIGKNTIPFKCDGLDSDYIIISGIVARSHGMDVRDTFDYLESLSGDRYTPFNIHAVYLMVLLRLADYLQIDSSRTNEDVWSIKYMYSPYSQLEHKTHESIKNVEFTNPDKEKIAIQAHPEDAQTYVKIERLAEDIQKEFDRSWAILGEVYTNYSYKLRYRRITTNIRNEKYKSKLDYVPQQFGFRYNNDLFKLLIAPLYGDDPSYGVRELVQNAVDACRLCLDELPAGVAHVKVEVDSENMLFTITDMGKGMNLYEIENYFLTIGSSYNENIDWKKTRDHEHLYRTGRFGIGVLAAFLLGPEVSVVTRKRNEEVGYRFTASLNDRFIQVEKVPNARYGTIIEIKCDETCIKKLQETKTYTKSKEWYGWYIGENPKVEYYFDGESKKAYFDRIGYRELKHSSEEYGTVYWKPEKLFKDFGYYNNKRSLYCNGFFIDEYPRKRSLIGFDEIETGIPSLLITDIYNQLPLNLTRNDIESSFQYGFEEDLAKEVFIDRMCQLMAIDNSWLSCNKCNFHQSGVSLKERYMTNRIKETKSLLIFSKRSRYSNSYLDRKKWNVCFKKIPSDLILIFENRYSGVEDRTFKKILKNKNFAFFALMDNRRPLTEKVKQYFNGKLIEFNNWLINAPKNSQEEALFIEIIKVNESLFESPIETLIITKLDKPRVSESYIDDLFEKYMHKDPVVPYDLEERKRKFPLLFKDYSEIIKQYMK